MFWKKLSRQLIRYFLQGLLFVTPLAVTTYVLFASFKWLDQLIEVDVPGLGILIIVTGILLLGFLASSILARPIFDFMEGLLRQLPLVNVIYSSLKDFVDAFVGNNRKFKSPVLVRLNKESEVYKLGFITQQSLDSIGITDKIAVYVPHSYNFSGDLFIVPKENITKIDASGSAMMKFIVSGGVSGFDEKEPN